MDTINKGLNQKIWSDQGGALVVQDTSNLREKLGPGVYSVNYHYQIGFHLKQSTSNFDINYKVYGMQTKIINRCVDVYEKLADGNMGVLLNGLKGTGKTVTLKQIAKKLGQPIVLVDSAFERADGLSSFLSSIPEDVTIVIDEYEKIFESSSVMLSLMDGAVSSGFRRFFILTTNNLNIDANLKQRPGRIRYLKHFASLKKEIVEEIIDDALEEKDFREECVDFIMGLNIITVDIVKSVVSEINLTGEGPADFREFINVEEGQRANFSTKKKRGKKGQSKAKIAEELIEETPPLNRAHDDVEAADPNWINPGQSPPQ